jgi:cobalamin biosynthesis Mg chelatase CobN
MCATSTSWASRNGSRRKNPTALAQTIERMIEAARQGYWQADPKVLVELQERYRDLARRHDVVTDNPVFKAFVDAGANAGFGLVAPLPATRPQQAADLVAPHEVPAAPQIEGNETRTRRGKSRCRQPCLSRCSASRCCCSPPAVAPYER